MYSFWTPPYLVSIYFHNQFWCADWDWRGEGVCSLGVRDDATTDKGSNCNQLLPTLDGQVAHNSWPRSSNSGGIAFSYNSNRILWIWLILIFCKGIFFVFGVSSILSGWLQSIFWFSWRKLGFKIGYQCISLVDFWKVCCHTARNHQFKNVWSAMGTSSWQEHRLIICVTTCRRLIQFGLVWATIEEQDFYLRFSILFLSKYFLGKVDWIFAM